MTDPLDTDNTQTTQGLAAAPKRPGRKKGSKNKSKTTQLKTRGRTSADKTQTQADNSRVDLGLDRTEQAHSAKRPPRVAMGASLKLGYHGEMDTENYHYRWVSDRDGRVNQAKQAWYEHVKDHSGDNVVRHVGAYGQHLMRVEKKYWVEDQELKQQKLAAKLQQEQVLKADEYLPDDRHHVLQKDDYDPLS